MKFFSSVPSPATDRSIRRYPRSIFTAALTLRHLGVSGVCKLRGITLDVSEGGMGALVQGNLQMGEAVEVDLHFEGKVLNAVAIVRHTSNVRQLLAGVPIRVVASLHDTSVQMIEQNYSEHIADHADDLARPTLLETIAEVITLPPASTKARAKKGVPEVPA